MSDSTVLEVVVYGDAPDDQGGGGTDVISIPADFYWYYLPLGPHIVNPPFPRDGGGGGGDVVDTGTESLSGPRTSSSGPAWRSLSSRRLLLPQRSWSLVPV